MTIKDVDLDGNSFPIREFQLDWMVPNPSICMIAKRGSGKSWIVRDILNHFHDIPGGVIISPTDKMSSFYGGFFPELYIHYEYSTDIIQNILTRQGKMIDKKREKKQFGKKVDCRAFLVMDDCLSSKGTWMKDEVITEMFFNGRHFEVMYILTMQFPLGITPELRTNFDYIFLLGEDFVSNQKRLYDHYAGMFPSFEAFKKVFLEVTNDFGCLVIVNRGSRRDLLDKVFWYKSQDIKILTLGSKQFNDFHKNNFNKDWRNKSKRFDLGDFINKRGKSASIPITKVKSHLISEKYSEKDKYKNFSERYQDYDKDKRKY